MNALHTRRFRTIRAGLFSSAILIAAGAAQAQTTDTTPPPSSTPNETVRTTVDGEDAIIVTARNYVPEGSITASKSDAPLIETPQSISVITRDQIDLLNFLDVQQAVRYSAGVVGENYGPDPRYDFLTVRGFTPKQYIDGLAAPNTTTIFSVGLDIYGFETVDVLKGPSSVLYGNSPPGGIFNLTSRRPSSEFGGEAGIRYGSYDTYEAHGTVTGAATDFLDVRATALYRNTGTQIDHVDAERIYVAPAATLKIGPDTKLTGLGYYQYDKIDGYYAGFVPIQGTLLPNPLGRVSAHLNLGEPAYNFYERRQWGAGYEFVHEFTPAVSFTSNTKWMDYDEYSQVVYATGLAADNRTVFRANFPYAESVKTFATDNRVDATVATGAIENRILAGIDYRNVRNDADFGFTGAPSIDLFDPVYGTPITSPGTPFGFNHQTLKQTGIYLQDQAKFGAFILTLAGRYDWAKITDRTAGSTTKQDKFTYRVGATFITESGIAPYASYSTSFEPTLGVDQVTGRAFKPSTGRQIEGGIKYDARNLGPDVRLFATAAVFDIKQKDVVGTAAGQTPVFGTQTGEVGVWGVELELVARIREQLSINGSYTYADSEVKKNGNYPQAVGTWLPATPRHKASLLVDYTIQTGPLGGLGGGVGIRYTSKSNSYTVGPFAPTGYFGEAATLFDALIHYDLPEWRLALNGSNIFDKHYVVRCTNPQTCAYAQDRQIFVSVTRKF